jgi:CBASS immunity sensor of nucleotide second messenger signals/HNH endonuclease
MKKKSKGRPASRRPRAAAQVVDVTRRQLRPDVRLRLYVEAGGRCEFDGCNKYLLEDPLTLTAGNYGQAAHIVAFQPGGPRGGGVRPRDINQVSNLMLLCSTSHKTIDDHPTDYTRETLREYKRSHEMRIKHLTDLGPDRKTAVLVLKAPINAHTVTIPFDHVYEATAPRYPTRRDPHTVDLTTITDRGPAFLEAGRDTIREEVDRFLRPGGEGRSAGHASVFAMAPIPLLVFLGRELTNKVPTDVFQRHRDTETWTWKKGGRPVRYTVKRLRRGSKRGKVALILALSGTIRVRDLPVPVARDATIYVITLAGQTPRPTFLRTRRDLEGFRTTFQEVIGRIAKHHGRLRAIDLFPAVPAPVAVLCGRELLPKVHPALRVWDQDKARGGFTFQLEVN